jgi:hypothetical protein
MSFFDRWFSRDAGEIEQLVAEARVGDEFRTWVQSDVGRYIIGRAEQHEINMLRELGRTSPFDNEKISLLQSEAKAPGLLIRWIEEVMSQGEQAKFQLQELEDE